MDFHIWIVYLRCGQGIGRISCGRSINPFLRWINTNRNMIICGLLGYFLKTFLFNYIELNVLVVTYVNKWCMLWGESHRSYNGKNIYLINRDMIRNTYLEIIRCLLFRFNYCFLFHWTMLYYNSLSISWMCLWVLKFRFFTVLHCLL